MPSLPVPYGGAFIIVSLFDGVLPFHVPLWRGPGGGFGLLGEQSLQQPPPAEEDRDTSTSSATFELEPFAFVLDPCIMSPSGGGQGEDSDCSGSNPYNNLRQRRTNFFSLEMRT